MPAAPLPFDDSLASGVEELAGAAASVVNWIHDPGSAMRTRPGLSTWDMFPAAIPNASPVLGAWVFGQYLVYATQDRKLWALIAAGLVVALSDSTAATQLDGTGRPQAVVTGSRIVIIGGGVPQKWEGTGLSARLGGGPPAGIGIALLTQTLVIATQDGILFWSQPGEISGHEDWRGDMASAEAEAGPDGLVALGSTTGELLAVGSASTQVFIPDPDAVFAPGPTVEIGSFAGSSLIKWDAQHVFFDDRRRVLATNGRTLNDIAGPALAQTLWRLSTVADCWGFRARFDSADLIALVFPTEGRAFVYNATVQKWAEWLSLDSDGRWLPWVGRSHCYWPERALHLVGLDDGSIAVLDPAAFTEAGLKLKAVMRTGFVDHEIGARKVCERVQLTMRRDATATTSPVAELRWRDNLGAFGQPLRFSLGAPGDYGTILSKWTLGVYDARQWELTVSDPVSFAIAGAEELFTPLEA